MVISLEKKEIKKEKKRSSPDAQQSTPNILPIHPVVWGTQTTTAKRIQLLWSVWIKEKGEGVE